MLSIARNAARAAAERLYEHSFVVLRASSKKRENGSIKLSFEQVGEEHACRISFKSSAGAIKGEQVSEAPQTVKLFCAPEIDLKAGSHIVVTLSENDIREYVLSGTSAVYPTHQEVELTLKKERL